MPETPNLQPGQTPGRPARFWYKCATCGNRCLDEEAPDNSICGGCKSPDWKLMKLQEAYWTHGHDWVHPQGEI